jgi:uncharacterized protein (TIGR03435 family)
MPRAFAVVVAVALASALTVAAQTTRLEFDVVSIKRSDPDARGAGMRRLPDGTLIMVNQPIRSIIFSASAVPAREVVGLPDWANTDLYDVTAKPPPGSTPEQRAEMMRTLFAERMKLIAHVEERERDTFALVLARSDGQLGPQLKKSTLDCTPRPPGSTPPPPPPDFFDTQSAMNRCGGLYGQGSIVSGGITMDQLVVSLTGLAGRQVNNRTGLQGHYAFTLTFSASRRPGTSQEAPAPDDAPEFFTALQEQLGLKLQPEKSIVPFLVIDRIERPTEN